MPKGILARFSNHTKKAIDRARLMAISQNAKEVTSVHLLYAISFEKGSVGKNILKEMGFEKSALIDFYQDFDTARSMPFSGDLKETIRQAAKIALEFHYPYIGTEHLVYAILRSRDKKIKEIINKSVNRAGGATDSTGKKSQERRSLQRRSGEFSGFGQIPDFLQAMNMQIMAKAKGNETNLLEKYANNLNRENQREEAHPIIARTGETDRLINILLRKNKNNPVLVGEPGVGKTAVVNALAQRINKGEVPAEMASRIIYELDLGLLLSGTTFRGEFEQRMKEVINQASRDDKIILFIDEIHNLMGAGSAQGSLDAANMLKPALAKGDLKLIGSTTFDEYQKHIEKDPALERRFQPIIIREPGIKETRDILGGIKKNYEKYHKVVIDKKAIEAAINLSTRFINDRFLPDKAIDLIDEAMAKARAEAVSFDITKKMKRCLDQKKRIKKLKERLILNNEYRIASGLRKDEAEINKILGFIKQEQARREKLAFLRVTEEDIKKIIAIHTGVLAEDITVEGAREALGLEKKLAKSVIGQRHIIKAAAKTIQRSLSGINDPSRPLGSFIFLGPTGVGKTYMAKTLAEVLFKNPASFIRIDMSEFSEKHHVSQLLGAPAGYVGYEDGGKLTDKVRRNPYSLILFDEIEKAHPEVFNILLQILEDGILTDAAGRTVNFKNTIIVMTSNVGAKSFIEDMIGFEGKSLGSGVIKKQTKQRAVDKLRDILLPELLNRIDHILVFDSLSINDLSRIAKNEADKLVKRVKEKKIKLVLDKKIFKYLARESFDKREGARLVRKKVEQLIQDPLAQIILNSKSKKPTIVEGRLKKQTIRLEVRA